MNDHINSLFVDNPGLYEQIHKFCSKNPEYLARKCEFYETVHEIARAVGYELYDRFEKRFALYMACSNDIHYLFGLGLRQEILDALQPKMS